MTATATETAAAAPVLHHRVKKDRPAPVARTAPRRNAAGHDLGTVDLEPTIFGLTPNRAVLHQVVTAQLAGIRAGTQSTRTRAEVRGGGAKPFRQKGTGRARQGSSRSPSTSGGGVALGPKPRSYAQHTPKKMVRLALLSALSDRADIGRIVVIDDWKIDEPDTKDAATIAAQAQARRLGPRRPGPGRAGRGAVVRQPPPGQTTNFAELSAHDVLRADWLRLLRPHGAHGRGGLLGDARGRGAEPSAGEPSEADDGLEPAEEATGAKPPRRPATKAEATKTTEVEGQEQPTKAEPKATSHQATKATRGHRAARQRRAARRPRAPRRGGRHRCVTPCPC